MSQGVASETAVRRDVTVGVDRERAFELFTTRMDAWWPREHHIGSAEIAEAILEPREGGRWYERGVDGSECEWGKVAEWSPPGRVVLVWQIDATWHYNPELVTEVEVTFTDAGPGQTRVELEHRHLDRFGEHAQAMRDAFGAPGGWAGTLARYAEATTL